MEKGYTPQESAPPYPGPPGNYGPVMPQPGMYPPPPTVGYQGGPPFVPATGVPTTTVTHMVVTPGLHEIPGQTVCPHCQQTVVTQIEHQSGLMTWLICGGLAIVGCFLCCCIPFCIDACKDVEHHCPNCHRVIYIYKRIK